MARSRPRRSLHPNTGSIRRKCCSNSATRGRRSAPYMRRTYSDYTEGATGGWSASAVYTGSKLPVARRPITEFVCQNSSGKGWSIYEHRDRKTAQQNGHAGYRLLGECQYCPSRPENPGIFFKQKTAYEI